jgi:oleate hydratase
MGVNFQSESRVKDIGLSFADDGFTVTRMLIKKPLGPIEIRVGSDDLVFLTNGSMVADTSRGSMTSAPELITSKRDGSFALWEKLAQLRPEFGRPDAFACDVKRSAWESFTVTARDPLLFDRLEALSGRKAGRGGLMTLVASNWLLTIALLHPPHFIDQPEGMSLAWGFGLFPESIGNFIRKPMRLCTGAEVLEELLRHLGLEDNMERMIAGSTCIPCLMPYAGSVFMPRKAGDRPEVVPRGSKNLAFIGQFCELPDDVVFTTEYSVRSARVAVATLLGLQQPPPVYKGEHDLKVIRDSLSVLVS